MEGFNAVFLFGLSLVAAFLSVGHQWEALHSKRLPDGVEVSWWRRLFRWLGRRLSFESFFRAFYLHLTFAGAAISAVTTGYQSKTLWDGWQNPNAPLLLCLCVGVWSQFKLKEDVLDSLSVSLSRIGRVAWFGFLTLFSYSYAVGLSMHYWVLREGSH